MRLCVCVFACVHKHLAQCSFRCKRGQYSVKRDLVQCQKTYARGLAPSLTPSLTYTVVMDAAMYVVMDAVVYVVTDAVMYVVTDAVVYVVMHM